MGVSGSLSVAVLAVRHDPVFLLFLLSPEGGSGAEKDSGAGAVGPYGGEEPSGRGEGKFSKQ